MSIPKGGMSDFNPNINSNDNKVEKPSKKSFFKKKGVSNKPVQSEEKMGELAKHINVPEGDKKNILGNRIIEDYQPGDEHPYPPTDMPPVLPDSSVTNIAKDTLGTPKIRTNKQVFSLGELMNNPLAQKVRKQADYDGEIKQNPEEIKAQEEFAEKAKGHGYRFDKDFEMYLPIVEGSKDPLTKEEMADLVEGKGLLKKEVKYEGRTHDLDTFASDAFYKFDEDTGGYISSNPFIAEKFMTIDDMQAKMAGVGDKEKIDQAAKNQGYIPVQGMDGLYQNQNDESDVRPADDFR